ncbi:hypothetical protein B484DRAFT_424898 [Ochromonadaceae sp. CCMP2298]|nr:hypothetical protein B484DRAFT_424898 [Ochromonadaceae sp. CCMP2298]
MLMLLAMCATAHGLVRLPTARHLGCVTSVTSVKLTSLDTSVQEGKLAQGNSKSSQSRFPTQSELDAFVPPPVQQGDLVDGFCRFMNENFKKLTIEPVASYVKLSALETDMSFLRTVTTPPQYPGVPRPVTLTVLASVPTLLGWYGYYKFSVEEELYQQELREKGRVSGCGGYGTLLPFVFLFLFGAVTSLAGLEQVSAPCLQLGGGWILLGQINLYRRVNEMHMERFGEGGVGEGGEGGEGAEGEPPLHAWWAILPPPLDVVVGLRQVHYLAKYWADVRDERGTGGTGGTGGEITADKIAELFPFICSERFTLKEFVTQPSRWFWFTRDYADFDFGSGDK